MTASSTHQRDSSALAAGLAVMLIGLANAGFGVASLTSDAVRLGPGATAGLLILGAITAVLGWLVLTGRPGAVTAALTLFGLLLVIQLGDAAAAGWDGGAGWRVGILAVLVAALAVAKRRTRG